MMIGYCLLFAIIGLSFVETTLAKNCSDVRINNGPLITPCVSEITLMKGQNFTLTCKGVTKLRFRHQDLSEEITDSMFRIKNTSSQSFEEEYSFQRTLDLYNVDQYAIGYYACSDDTVHENIVNTIIEEPENNEHVSYIYVYVNGTDSLFAPMSEIIMSRSNKILIECRPSTPDVKVELSTKSQNKTPKREYTKYSPKIGFLLKECDKVAYLCEGLRGTINETKRIRINVNDPPVPRVGQVPQWFLPGENFTLNCTANITPTTSVYLRWNFPEGLNKDNVSFNESKSAENITNGEIYNALTIYNARPEYEGLYSCTSTDSCVPKDSNEVLKRYTNKPILSMRIMTKPGITKQSNSDIKIKFDSHPEANITVLKDGKELPSHLGIYKNGNLPRGMEKYTLLYRPQLSEIMLSIWNLTVTDIADYTIIADNKYNRTSATIKVEVADGPHVNFGLNHKTCDNGKEVTFRCDVSGYPLPTATWTFSYNDTDNNTVELLLNSTDEKITSAYNKTAFYHNKMCDKKGIITCIATGIKNRKRVSVSQSHDLIVYDIHGGFGISTDSKNGTIWALENNQLSLKCLASLYDFSKVTWKLDDSIKWTEIVDIQSETDFSMVAELKINNLNLNHNGKYTCVGEKIDGSIVSDHIEINVQELLEPMIVNNVNLDEEVIRFDDKYISCTVRGAPLPEIKWYKDGKLLVNSKNVNVTYNKFNRTAAISSISIIKMVPDNVGTYECVTEGKNPLKKSVILRLKVEEDNNFMHYLIPILVIIVVLIIMIVYLTLKVKKEKKFRKELAAAGLLYFKEGVVNSLNPDLGIDEQAELLPYDEKFEFPPEKLVYGKQLGSGAFGIVYKAEARGIINAEETTTVAVKMVKKTADNMYIKALASELKIMVHLGKHINIVNLLGACTKNVGKRELVVIVEYCMYGNIHNYMQRHREVFIDQLETDNKEKLGRVNRAYTSTTGGSTGVQSDYFGSTNTQDTDNTFLNTGNTVRSGRKNIPNNQPTEEVKASECYVQPDWRSNYESDYSYDGRSPRPLTSRDLLAWAFQIARGMEYLASRKVLHGDLAARNILLAEDNIVKICDFGLAKSIYKNEEYQPKENCLLPVKWLALECMTDRIFSTQSDVWSFGIVLWELFTLAKTPYPNIHPSSLLQFLSEGHRLDKPAYADDRLYDVMMKCWEAKPTLRPSFSHLQELLGTFLEDNVRKHYVDLNSTYMDKHASVSGQEDYLAMMCAPDYNNLVTPSPHHYINTDKENSFFPPTPVKVDEGGYLQMSPTNQGIFSPRLPNSEFDFDPRKFNPKTSEASSCGSELTPMLTLNNLPARSGSESDHEGNAPYLNVCPRIDEEADEVFARSINDTKNAKNMQQSAVTNPTYITFVNIDEKPKDINSYVNINVLNDLVK